MSQTYSVTGINLKSMALGESDRLLTILTPEKGLLRAVASGARKQNSRLGGRTALFVVNHYLMAKGRSLDKVLQAETHLAFTGLSRDLGRLTASQYLAELALVQAIEGQPQAELFITLQQELRSLEDCPTEETLAYLLIGILRLLNLAGLTPEVQVCCLSRQPILPQQQPSDWQVEFSQQAGGLILPQPALVQNGAPSLKRIVIHPRLSRLEVIVLQQFAQIALNPIDHAPGWTTLPDLAADQIQAWVKLETILRSYIQYHFERPLRSAELISACWQTPAWPNGGTSP